MNSKNYPVLKSTPQQHFQRHNQEHIGRHQPQYQSNNVLRVGEHQDGSPQSDTRQELRTLDDSTSQQILRSKPKKVRPPSADYNGRNRVLKRNNQSDALANMSNAHYQNPDYTDLNLTQPANQKSESMLEATLQTEQQKQDSKLRIETAEQNNGIYIDSQESYVPGIDSAEENPASEQLHNKNFLSNFNHPPPETTNNVYESNAEDVAQQEPHPENDKFDFFQTLDDPVLPKDDFDKISKRLNSNYQHRRVQSLHKHDQSFQRFQNKEQRLIQCYKVWNENPDKNQRADNFKRIQRKKQNFESEAVSNIKVQAQNAYRTIQADIEHKNQLNTLVQDMQQVQWDNFNSNSIVQDKITMVNYMQPQSEKQPQSSIVSKIKLKTSDFDKARRSTECSPTINHNETIKSISTKDFHQDQRRTSTIDQQDGFSIFATDNQLKKEMICHQKACAAVVQLQGNKRNAPNLKLGNPREEARRPTRTEIVEIRNQQTQQKKEDWKSFVGYISKNPDALMSLVATPVEPDDIIQGLHPLNQQNSGGKEDTRYRALKENQHRNSQSIKSQINRSELTRIHSGVSTTMARTNCKNTRTRPQTGNHRRSLANHPQQQSNHLRKGFKSRPLTGNPTGTRKQMSNFVEDVEIFSNNSKSKVETVLKMLNRNSLNTPCTQGQPPQKGQLVVQSVTPCQYDRIDLEQITESAADATGTQYQTVQKPVPYKRGKGRTLKSAVVGNQRRINQNSIVEKEMRVHSDGGTSQPQALQPVQLQQTKIEMQDHSLQSRQDMWNQQLSIKCLQENSNHPLSNYQMTNRKLRQQAQQNKEDRAVDFLVSFNLSQKLIQELSIQRDVKYFKDSTLQGLTGVITPPPCDSRKSQASHTVVEEEKLGVNLRAPIDWRQTELWKNLRHSDEFNHAQNPLFLSETQISYCINLLRYCETQFEDKEKLRQLFHYVIATTHSLYQELSLSHQFDRLSLKLDEQSIIDTQTCEKLLIRCQLLLSLRGELTRVLQNIATAESLVYGFTLGRQEQPQSPTSAELSTQQKISEIEAQCDTSYTLIAKLVQDRHQLIGKTFMYEGSDFALPQNLKLKLTSQLLQGLNQKDFDCQIHQQVQQHKQASSS